MLKILNEEVLNILLDELLKGKISKILIEPKPTGKKKAPLKFNVHYDYYATGQKETVKAEQKQMVSILQEFMENYKAGKIVAFTFEKTGDKYTYTMSCNSITYKQQIIELLQDVEELAIEAGIIDNVVEKLAELITIVRKT